MENVTAKLIINSTQIPNIILDEWMPKLSPSEFQLVMVIARQTYGWHKETEWIAYSQFGVKTGLSLDSVAVALKSLKQKGYIQTFTKDGNNLEGSSSGRRQIYYRINYQNTEIPTIDGKKSEIPSFKTRKNRDIKETNIKEIIISKDIEPKARYGNDDVNRILEEFTELTGYSKPTDRAPRIWASNFAKHKGLENFLPCLRYLLEDKKYDLNKLETVYRKYPVYEAEVLKVRPTTKNLSKDQEERISIYANRN